MPAARDAEPLLGAALRWAGPDGPGLDREGGGRGSSRNLWDHAKRVLSFPLPLNPPSPLEHRHRLRKEFFTPPSHPFQLRPISGSLLDWKNACSVQEIDGQSFLPFSAPPRAAAAGLNLLQGAPAARKFLRNRCDCRGPNERFRLLVPDPQEFLHAVLQLPHAAERPRSTCVATSILASKLALRFRLVTQRAI